MRKNIINHSTILRSLFIIIVTLLLIDYRIFGHALFNNDAAPIHMKKEATTAKMFSKQMEHYYQRVMIDAYQKVGQHSSIWDAEVIALLEGYIENAVVTPGTYKPEWFITRAQRIMAKGCNDPLVSYLCGRYLNLQGKYPEARHCLLRAYYGFQQYHYAKAIARMAPIQLAAIEIPNKKKSAVANINEIAAQWSADAMTDGSFAPSEQRIALAMLRNDKDAYMRILPYLVPLLQRTKDVDPYVMQVIEGEHEFSLAWQESDANWRGKDRIKNTISINKHLWYTRKVLTAAWKLHPEYPEAPTLMMCVAREDKNDKVRRWFDRAVSAQFDYIDAYCTMGALLRPQRRMLLPNSEDAYKQIIDSFGGGYEHIYQFGLSCLKTKRYDTNVPYFFFQAIAFYIARDKANTPEGEKRAKEVADTFWRRPETYPHLKEMFEGYAPNLTSVKLRDTQSRYLACAWYLKHYDDARVLLDKLGEDVNRDVFSELFNVDFTMVCEDIFTRAQPYAGMLHEAEVIADRQGPQAARVAYTRLLKKKHHPCFTALVKKRLALLR